MSSPFGRDDSLPGKTGAESDERLDSQINDLVNDLYLTLTSPALSVSRFDEMKQRLRAAMEASGAATAVIMRVMGALERMYLTTANARLSPTGTSWC